MNKLINELTMKISSASLTEVRANYEEYQKLVSACQTQLFKLSKILEEERNLLEQKKMQQLLSDTQYVGPVYPQISYEDGDAEEVEIGINGSCIFATEEQSKDLIKRLVNQSYYYGHTFKWAGSGRYTIVPSWKYDHDGEVIYTATYKMEEV